MSLRPLVSPGYASRWKARDERHQLRSIECNYLVAGRCHPLQQSLIPVVVLRQELSCRTTRLLISFACREVRGLASVALRDNFKNHQGKVEETKGQYISWMGIGWEELHQDLDTLRKIARPLCGR